MKQEIKLLRKAQKIMWDNMYPGYPYQLTLVIDLKEKIAYVDWCGKKQPLKQALKDVYASLLYVTLGAENTEKQSFLVDQHLEEYKKYLNYDYDDFFIDNINAAKFYFALNSAIYNRKKDDDNHYIFACIDDDCDLVDVEVFNNLEEIQDYINDYFGGE